MKKLNFLYLALSLAIVICPFSQALEGKASPQNDPIKGLIEAGKLDEALAIEKQEALKNPKSSSPHMGLTIIYQRMGNWKMAFEEAQLAVKLDPNSSKAHYNLASILHGLRRLDEAKAEYEKAISLGKNDVNAHRGAAQCLLELGQIPAALSRLEALSKRFPDNKDVWLNLGRAYLLYGDVGAADAAAEKAYKLAPDYYPAIILKADIKLATSQYGQAQELANQAQKMNPSNPVAYLLLGQLASMNLDKPQEAQAVIDMARKNINKAPEVFFVMGTGFARVASTKTIAQDPQLSKKWWSMSIQSLKLAADQAPDALEPNLIAAKLLVDKRRPVDALPYAERAIKLAPDNKQAQQVYKSASVARYDLVGNLLKWFNVSY